MKNKTAAVKTLLEILQEIKPVPTKADGSLDTEKFKELSTVKSVVSLIKFIKAEDVMMKKFPVANLLFSVFFKEGETGHCVLCPERFYSFGHNPSPLSEEGRCCDKCNSTKVIKARLERISAR